MLHQHHHHHHYYCRYEAEDLPFQPLLLKAESSCWRRLREWLRRNRPEEYMVDTRPVSVVLGQDQITGRIVTYTDDTNHFQSRIITLPGDAVFVRW